MTVKEYMEQQKQKMMEARLKEKSKDAVVKRENVKSDEKERVKQFYKALASGDRSTWGALNKDIANDYKQKAQTVGTSTQGGLLVPTTIRESILMKMRFISPVRQIATVLDNMPANLSLPSENALPTVYWVSEGTAITESGVTFSPNTLTPYKLAGLDSFTSEVLDDTAINPSLQNYVEDRFAIALALKENDAFVNGDGSGKPFGFRSSAITPATAATNSAAGNYAYANATALKYALPIAYRQLGVYVTSGTGVGILENVKDTTGRPIWREDMTGNTPGVLLGRPLYVVDEIPINLGAGTNETELWFGLFSNYLVGDRGPLRIDYGTNGTDFAQDKISLRMIKRVAGSPMLGESFAKQNIK